MPEAIETFTVETFDAIASIDPSAWDRCAGEDNPFVLHAHIRALEESGSATPETGYRARHLALRGRDGALAAVAPAYLKDHSFAEVGVDMGFAVAHERLAGPYYPKLQVEIPLTLMRSPVLLAPEGPARDSRRSRLLAELQALAEREGAASLQLACMDAEDGAFAAAAGLQTARSTCFVWRNRGHGSFQEFLSALTKSRRTMIRRERRRLGDDGLRIRWVAGADLPTRYVDRMSALFNNTFEKYRTDNLHTPAFLRMALDRMADKMAFALAEAKGELVAATVFFQAKDGLFASQWGASVDEPFLHFELTFYLPIEKAIEQELAFVNFGSVGSHKAPRGGMPTDVFHAFRFRDPAFADIIAGGLARKEKSMLRERASQALRNPYQADRDQARTKEGALA